MSRLTVKVKRCRKRSMTGFWVLAAIVDFRKVTDISRRGRMDADNGESGTAVDWTEVSREAHELALRHGPTAHVFALKLADQAQAAGDFDAARFWRAVSQSIATRTG